MNYKFIPILLLFCVPQLQAQQSGVLQFSIFGGFSVSNIVSAQDLIDSNLRPGVNAGIAGDYYFSEPVSLELAVFFNQNGRVIDKLASNDGRARRTLSLHYITVALLPNYHFGQNFNWYIKGGPYISFLAGANQGRSDISAEIESTDVGLTGGLGYQLPISASEQTQLFIELIHQLGISNIIIDNVNEDIRNTRSSLNLGISF